MNPFWKENFNLANNYRSWSNYWIHKWPINNSEIICDPTRIICEIQKNAWNCASSQLEREAYWMKNILARKMRHSTRKGDKIFEF